MNIDYSYYVIIIAYNVVLVADVVRGQSGRSVSPNARLSAFAGSFSAAKPNASPSVAGGAQVFCKITTAGQVMVIN